jgi:hypothetical protein
MTAGVNVPFDLALIEDLYDALPFPLVDRKRSRKGSVAAT